MNDPDLPGQPALPPDLPAEYADAYRRAYEDAQIRTTQNRTTQNRTTPNGPVQDGPAQDGPAQDRPGQQGPIHGAAAAAEVVTLRSARQPGDSRSGKPLGWRWPLVAGAGVLLVLLAAYALGRGLGDDPGDGSGDAKGAPAAASISSSTESSDSSKAASPPPSRKPETTRSASPSGEVWDGDVKPVAVGSVTSSCHYQAGVDAAGRRVTYRPVEAADADFTTAWRCAGNGHGAYLRMELPTQATVAEVGLVPGYAKTDPNDHADRYAENNRITKVRWTFDDGTSVEQTFDGSPRKREPQTMRIVPRSTGSVTVTILGSVPGPRNTVAISEVVLGQQVG